MIHIFVAPNEEGFFIATVFAESKEIASAGGETLGGAVSNAIRYAEISAWHELVKDKDEDDDDDKDDGKGGLN